MFKIKILSLLLISLSFVLGLIGCERKSSNKATVSIQFPEYQANALQSKVQEQAQSGNTRWGLSAVKDYSAANCYAVVVTGPNINTTASCEDSSGHQTLELGDVYGQFPAGSSAEIHASAGVNRTFSIIAFYSKDPSCQEILKNPFNPLISSRPLVIGKAVADLSPGDNNVEINLNLADSKEIETCKGPLFESFTETTWPNLTILKSSPQISLGSKMVTPSSNATPTFTVNGVLEGDKIDVYSDDHCNNFVTSKTSTSNSADIILPKILLDGVYNYYVVSTANEVPSPCSPLGAQYELDTTPPQIKFSNPSRFAANRLGKFQWTISYSGADLIYLRDNDIKFSGESQGCIALINGTGISERTLVVSGCTGNGDLTLSLAPSTALDRVGNKALGVEAFAQIKIDNINPTVALTSETPKNGKLVGNSKNIFSWELKYSGADSISLSENDITLSGATAGCVKSISGSDLTTRLVNLTNCSGYGDLSWTLATNTAADMAANRATSISQQRVTVKVDNTLPQINIQQLATQKDSTNTLPIVFTLSSTKALDPNTFTIEDIKQNGTATGINWVLNSTDNINWTLQATSLATNGTVIPSIDAGKVADLVGNLNEASKSTDNSVNYDNTAPTVKMSLSPDSKTYGYKNSVFKWNLDYMGADEITLTEEHIILTGAKESCLKSVSGSGLSSRVVTITGCTGKGDLSISLAAGTAADSTGNLAAGVSSDHQTSLNLKIDNTPLILSLSKNNNLNDSTLVTIQPEFTNKLPISFLLTSNKPLDASTFTAEDIKQNGTATGVTWSVSTLDGLTWIIKATAINQAGTLNPSIEVSKLADLFGMSNEATSSANISVTYDITPPTIKFGTSTANIKTMGNSSTSFVWDLIYSGADGISLTEADILLTGATAGCTKSISGSDLEARVITLTGCSGDGDLSMSLAAGTAADLAGNKAPVLSYVNKIKIDNTAPAAPKITTALTGVYVNNQNFKEFTLSGTCEEESQPIQIGGDVTAQVTCVNKQFTAKLNLSTLTNGNVNLNLKQADAVGNVSSATSVVLNKQVQDPVVTLDLQPAGLVIQNNFFANVGDAATITQYKYKFGVATTTNCADAVGYPAAWSPIADILQADSTSLAAGSVKLCVVGQDQYGNVQSLANATTKIMLKDTVAAEVNFADYERFVDTGSGAAQFKITLSVAKTYDIKIYYLVEGDAIYSIDHNLLGNQEITIPAGQTSVNIDVTIYQNNVASAGYSILRPKMIRADKDNVSIGVTNQSNLFIKYPGDLYQVAQIEVSDYGHSCAILTSGALKCWGSNTVGQIGNGNNYDQSIPVTIDKGVNYSQVVFGDYYTCGLTISGILKCWGFSVNKTVPSSNVPKIIDSGVNYLNIASTGDSICGITFDKTLKCWGSNNYGQVGDGTNITKTTPVVIDPGVSYSSIMMTKDITVCGITTLGDLKCWGYNSVGQVGDGTAGSSADKKSPVIIDPGVKYQKVIVRDSSSCGITIEGVLKCWGYNRSGQIGDGTIGIGTDKSSPVVVDSGVSYSQILKGRGYTCGITKLGILKCWGSNSDYQLGTGNSDQQSKPTIIDPGVFYKSILTTYNNTCGIASTGSLKCWGGSLIGNGANRTIKSPTIIDNGLAYSKITSSYNSISKQICGVTELGFLKCWGNNSIGQLGNLSSSLKKFPTEIDQGVKYNSVSGGRNFTCALTINGIVKCWGSNGSGQIGNGNTESRFLPIITSSGYSLNQLVSGENNSCGITKSGQLRCWGANGSGQIGKGSASSNECTPFNVDVSTNYIQLSKGTNHTCGITNAGVLKCWGANDNGQLGDGTKVSKASPVTIDSGVNYSQVVLSKNSNYSCAITTNGVLKCWGLNSSGQLGDGTLLDKSIPIVVDPNTTYTKISLSYDYICGITSAGNLKCWGSNSLSKIGDGTTTNVINPKLIDEGVTYQKIITGNLSTYGITSDGVLKGWGYQHSGLGTGDNGSKLPTVIDAGVKYSQVITSFNSNHSCAITNSGVLKCWGRNDYGQLGTGNTVSQNKPQVIDSGVNYLKVFIRGDLTCGITTDNSLKCWGRNDNGELGDGGDPSFMMRPLNIMKWVSDLIL